MRITVWLSLGAAALTACSNDAQEQVAQPEEDLTIVVEADKSRILAEEQELKQKNEAVRSERERLQREREEVSEKLQTLSKKDKKQRDKLEAEQARLEAEEKRVRDQVKAFEDDREKLQRDKDALLDRIASMTKRGRGGMTIEEREAAIAQREQQVAAREAKLTEREGRIRDIESDAVKVLSDANRLLAELGANAGKTVVVTAAAAPSGKTFNKNDAQRIQRQARTKMSNKGILSEDLPPTARALNEQIESSLGSKDFTAAAEYATQLEQVVDSIIINQEFVKAKMTRLNKAIADQKLDEKRQGKVNGLLQELGEAFTDGHYDSANRKANQIAQVLKGG
jgi:chromosome segregation ATPase